MASIFTKIIRGEVPSYKVAEDDRFVAFLDIRPIKKGHTLVVPREEIDYIFDLSEDTLQAYLPFARKVARAIEQVVPCKRIGLAVVGFEVPHAHLHLIPLDSIADIDFRRPPVPMSPEEMQALADQIASAFQKLQ